MPCAVSLPVEAVEAQDNSTDPQGFAPVPGLVQWLQLDDMHAGIVLIVSNTPLLPNCGGIHFHILSFLAPVVQNIDSAATVAAIDMISLTTHSSHPGLSVDTPLF